MAKFKQGESGNPEGRPKGSVSITSAIRRKLEEINPTTKRLYIDDLVDTLIDKAIEEGDFRVMKEIWNHVDGSPRQTNEVAGENNKPIPIMGGLSLSFDKSFEAKKAIADYLNISEEAKSRYNQI